MQDKFIWFCRGKIAQLISPSWRWDCGTYSSSDTLLSEACRTIQTEALWPSVEFICSGLGKQLSVEELMVQAGGAGHLVNGLKVQRQVGVVDGVVLGAVIDIRDLADVVLLLLLIVEGLQQLAPPVKHEQQPLTATWHSPLQRKREKKSLRFSVESSGKGDCRGGSLEPPCTGCCTTQQ